MNLIHKTLLAAALCGAVLAATPPALAQDDPSSAQLLQLIRQQAEQIKALERRLNTLEAGKAQASAAAPVPAPAGAGSAAVQGAVADTQQSQIDALQAQVTKIAAGGVSGGGGSIDWSYGMPQFRSPDGFFTFRPTGRLLFDYSTTHGSNYDARNIDGTEGRELRIGVAGSVGSFGYKLETDYQNETVGVKDAWLSYNTRYFSLPVTFYVGNHLKERGIEASSELPYIPFMERGAVASVVEPVNTYYGLGGFMKIKGANWHLSMSVTGNQLNSARTDDDSMSYSVRGHWNPVQFSQGFVYLGSSYWYEKIASDVTSINNTPTIAGDFNANLQVSSGSIADPRRDQGNGYELAGAYRGLWTYNEYGRRRIQTDSLEVIDHKGASFAAGWLITGEKPGLDPSDGIWRGTHVLHPVTAGGLGAWELVGRFDRFDFGDAPKGSVAHSATYGINWYLTDWSRLMLEYIDWNTDNQVGSFTGPDSGYTINMRAQLVF